MILQNDFDFFDRFFSYADPREKQPTFPRATIFIDQENKLVFNFALAGFTKEDIQLSLENDKLTIQGRKENKPLDAKKVFQNHIAYRDFHVLYRIPSEYVSPDIDPDACFENGILTIKLEPKNGNPLKLIEIK